MYLNLAITLNRLDDGGALPPPLPQVNGTLEFPEAIKDQPYYYNISDLISGATTYGYNGKLPEGITFDPNTGIFAGTPTAEDSQNISVYGTNSEGTSGNTNTDTLDVTLVPLNLLSMAVRQTEVPNGNLIMRTESIYVDFDQPVLAFSTVGVTATVHGAVQTVVLSGSGTSTLRFGLQRAIFRHEVTWSYDSALGDIVSESTGLPLSDVPTTVVDNELPPFLVWDWNAGAPDANTDTTWDSDKTRFDEAP